jgi:carbamoyltransferase
MCGSGIPARRRVRILGFNAYAHDAGIALVEDGCPTFALEQERCNRLRKTGAFPIGVADYLRRRLGVRLFDVDLIAFPWHPARVVWMGVKLVLGSFPPAYRLLGRVASPHANLPAAIKLLRAGNELARAFESRRCLRTHFVPHHLAHACNAFFLSPFESAAVLIMDGYGDECSTSWYRAEGSAIRLLAKNHPFDSLGILYALVSKHLGFRTVLDEGKVMALAAYGSDVLCRDFRSLIEHLPNGRYRFDRRFFEFHRYGEPRPFSDAFVERFGSARHPDEPIAQHHMDLAHALQRSVEETIIHSARSLQRATGQKNLCFGGGVALNCVANTRLAREAGFDRVHVTHSPNDAGVALGAALALAHLGRSEARPPAESCGLQERLTPFLGPEYSDRDQRAALEAGGLRFREEPDVVAVTAGMLAQGQIVGWFQGRAELGPRALGNRSILADPRDAAVCDRLNRHIKHREWFRPYAPAVLAQHASAFFEMGPSSPYMSFAVQVRPERRAEIPAVVSHDGSARIQTVTPDDNPLFYRLIEAFHRATAIPLVLNTSFNVQEPIVCTPDDAVRTFRRSGLDALVMGRYVARA